ncbi:MAG: cytochrome P450 [Acidimicrobiales bacterium]
MPSSNCSNGSTDLDPRRVTLDDLTNDAHRVHHLLRAHGSVVWLDCLQGWIVLDRPEAIAVLRDANAFTVDDPRFSTAQVIGPSMLSLDGDDHARHRAPFSGAFTPTAVGSDFEEWLDAAARELLAQAASAEEFDLRTDYAGPLASAAIVELLDLHGVDRDTVLSWYRDIVSAVEAVSEGGTDVHHATAAVNALRRTVDSTIASTHSKRLVDAAASLEPTEVASNVAVLMFGAIETGEGTISNLLLHVMGSDDVRARIAANPSLIGAAIDESLRLEPAAGAVHRYATTDTTIGGAKVRKGDFVVVSLSAANRDPAFFTAPDDFDLDRVNSRAHIAFAQGPHACIGIHVARLEARIALAALLGQRPDLRLAADGHSPPAGLIFRKPRALPVTAFHPRS